MKKLLVMDFDGTLVPKSVDYNDLSIDIINKLNLLKSHDFELMIATGRHPSYIAKRVKSINFNNIIGYSGNIALIDNSYDYYDFDINVLKEIYEFSIKHENVEVIIYDNDAKVCCMNEDSKNNFRTRLTTGKADVNGMYDFLIDDLLNYHQDIKISRACVKFWIADNLKQYMDNFTKEFNHKFSDYRLVDTGSIRLLEIMHNGYSKASGINKVINHLKVKKDNVFTIGDDMNDLEMLKVFKNSYYVGNKNNKVLTGVAKYNCKNINEALDLIIKEVIK